MTDFKLLAKDINNILEQHLPSDTSTSIVNAMNYSVLNGGKRLRGMMLLESFKLFTIDNYLEELLAFPFVTAIECIHAYSLVHDDLPEMDNDTYRRGILTTHAKFGHAMGTLTGDALLNFAFEIMSSTGRNVAQIRGEMSSDLCKRLVIAESIIGEKAGYRGMIAGQVLDIYSDNSSGFNKEALFSHLLKIYELKTSCLFEAALCSGAALGGASTEDIKMLEEYGYHLGLAFQIKDDILDETSTFEELGKDIGSDAKNGKVTIATLFGLDKAQELLESELNKALSSIERINGNKTFFCDLIEYLKHRTK